MDILTSILVFLHVVGATMVVGIWIANFKKGIVVPGQFHAALLQLVTGFALYFIMMARPGFDAPTTFHMYVGIKMLLGIIVAIAAYFGQKRYKASIVAQDPALAHNIPLAHTVGGLGLINIAIATILL